MQLQALSQDSRTVTLLGLPVLQSLNILGVSLVQGLAGTIPDNPHHLVDHTGGEREIHSINQW